MNKRQKAKHADRGASLIIVLIVISVVGVVTGVVLSQVDTSVRSTVQLRDQASDNYSADGATQAVLNGLASSGINCNDPTNSTGVTLGNTVGAPFYSPASSEQGAVNAYAKCTPDAITGASPSTSTPPPVTSVSTVTPAPVTSTAPSLGGGDATLPSYALLTTGSQSTDFGFHISVSAGNETVCIENGSVRSNADINATNVSLTVRLAGTGTSGGACTTGTGVDSTTGSQLTIAAKAQCLGGSSAFTLTACQSAAQAVAPPDPPSLADPVVAVNPAPQCDSTNTYAAFVPGLYTDVSLLNTPCSGKIVADFEWFSPGTYYFNYGATPWTWPVDRLLGGTPVDSQGNPITGLDPRTPSTLSRLSNASASPGACADPAATSDVNGVALVFGGASVMAASHQGVAEICASSPSGKPPVAIYGLAADQTVSVSAQLGGGSVTIPAETMCSSGCGSSSSLIQTDSGCLTQIYIKGYVYAPQAQLLLNVKDTVGQVFNWGIVIRNLNLVIGGSSPTQAVIHLPRPNTGVGPVVTTTTPAPHPSTSVSTPPPTITTNYTIRYVSVWICTVASLQQSGKTSCPTSGIQPNVQARILTNANGTPVRVLSWNHIR